MGISSFGICVAILVLAICELAAPKSVKSSKTQQNSDEAPLVYMDEDIINRYGSVVRRGVSEPSPCPENQLYCSDTTEYPKQKIKDLLKNQPRFIHGHFNNEVEETDFNRFDPNYNPDEHPLCSSSTTVVYPTKAKSKDGLFEFVVNDEEHRQGVRVEACGSNVGECDIPGSLSNGYKSRCVQKHILRTLVVFNQNSSSVEGFVTKPFEFPSCCSCVVYMTADRFGVSITPAVSKPKNTKT